MPAPVSASTPLPAFSVRAAQVRAQVAQAQVKRHSPKADLWRIGKFPRFGGFVAVEPARKNKKTVECL